MTTSATPAVDHPVCLALLARYLREAERIVNAWDLYADEHTDLDGWPFDDDAYGRRASRRDADTWHAFQSLRPHTSALLETAQTQLERLPASAVQPRWAWQHTALHEAAAELDALHQDWQTARNALPATATEGSAVYEDAFAERTAEAWGALDAWATCGRAVLEIYATTHHAKPAPAPSPAPAAAPAGAESRGTGVRR
ncbi:hypothetical protein ACFH04_13685 [Streptomyces noboritoensis]|uniref:Uncharacterized protein n=1 Tax=Streptomyces noboritoensis TaxID=67337 RepID=A0ABV6TG33_9ACTN